MTYPGGGAPIQRDTTVKQPKRIGKAVQVFKPVIRKVVRRGKA